MTPDNVHIENHKPDTGPYRPPKVDKIRVYENRIMTLGNSMFYLLKGGLYALNP